jgi:hypothetical protein
MANGNFRAKDPVCRSESYHNRFSIIRKNHLFVKGNCPFLETISSFLLRHSPRVATPRATRGPAAPASVLQRKNQPAHLSGRDIDIIMFLGFFLVFLINIVTDVNFF